MGRLRSEVREASFWIKVTLGGVLGLVVGIGLIATGGKIKLREGNMDVPFWPWHGIALAILGAALLGWVAFNVFRSPPKAKSCDDAALPKA